MILNAPLVWIITPVAIGLLLLLIRQREKLAVLLGVLSALLLAGLAWLEPIGTVYRLGPLAIELTEELVFLGRRFVLENQDAPALILIYLGSAFWFGGAIVVHTRKSLTSAGLIIAALMTAVLAVELFLFAALLIELAALVCVVLLAEPGKPVDRGVLRFLTFQTLGMPFILFTGWILADVGASPEGPTTIAHAGVLLGLGFAFLLGIFPFHTWIPMLAERANPYIAVFVFYVLGLTIPLFGLGLLDRYPGLRQNAGFIITLAGLLMTLTGGLWIAFQRHLGRMIGYAVMVEIGLSLLAAGAALNPQSGHAPLGILFTLLLPRSLGLAIWALALTSIRKRVTPLEPDGDVFRFRNMIGVAHKLPVSFGALLLAQFSLAGLPLLAGFPPRFALWEALAEQNILFAVVAVVGNLGVLIGGLRTLSVGVAGQDSAPFQFIEGWGETIYLVVGVLALLVVGIFPQWFLPGLMRMTGLFLNLGP